MKYRELREQFTHVGITGREFANLIGLNPRSLSNYAPDDQVPEHWAVIITLMATLAEHQLDFRGALSNLSPKPVPKRPRGTNIQQHHNAHNGSDFSSNTSKKARP